MWHKIKGNIMELLGTELYEDEHLTATIFYYG